MAKSQWFNRDNGGPCYSSKTKEHCKSRKLGCHGTCEKYQRYKIENDSKLQRRYQQKNIDLQKYMEV